MGIRLKTVYFRLLKVIWVLVLLQEYCQITQTTTTATKYTKRVCTVRLTPTIYIAYILVKMVYVQRYEKLCFTYDFFPIPPPSICLPLLSGCVELGHSSLDPTPLPFPPPPHFLSL